MGYLEKFFERRKEQKPPHVERAVEEGKTPEQLYEDALAYVDGTLGENRYDVVFDLIYKAATMGHADAMYELGVIYEFGLGAEPSLKEALEWYTRAAAQGSADAMYSLGLMYSEGNGVPESKEESEAWFAKAFSGYQRSADAGNSYAEYALGCMYSEGRGTEVSESEGTVRYSRAASKGNILAMNNLGIYHAESGSYREALRLFREAANSDDCALYNLGHMYLDGMGVDQSDEIALDMFRKSAGQGNGFAINAVELYESIGMLDSDGFIYSGPPIRRLSPLPPESFDQYSSLAKTGHAWAQYRCAICCTRGAGVEQSDKEAFEYLFKAARQGNYLAQHAVGECYQSGKGVKKSESEARKWHKMAADQGYADSRAALAYLDDR